MGEIYTCKCDKCGYSFGAWLGVGFLFPKVYEETVEKMKSGFYGQQGKDFFEAFPDGAISCEGIVVQCDSCREFSQVPELTMYIPNEGYNPDKNIRKQKWSVAMPFYDANYVSSLDLEQHYTEFEKYNHHCPECNGNVRVIQEFTDYGGWKEGKHVKCPHCKNSMEIELDGIWD